jgi:hypothetical protein
MQTSGDRERSAKPTESLTENENGNFLAKKDRDLDQDKDQNPPTPQNEVSTDNEPEIELTEVDGLQNLMLRKWPDLMQPPPYTTVNRLYQDYGIESVTVGIEGTPLVIDNMKWTSICKYVESIAKKIKFGDAKANGAKLDVWESDLRVLQDQLQELEDAGTIGDPRNKGWLDHNLPKIDRLTNLIKQNGGRV